MSLVNDMLNDLDERRSQQPQEEVDLQWLGGGKPAKKDKRYGAVIIASLALAVSAVALVGWLYQPSAALEQTASILKAEPLRAGAGSNSGVNVPTAVPASTLVPRSIPTITPSDSNAMAVKAKNVQEVELKAEAASPVLARPKPVIAKTDTKSGAKSAAPGSLATTSGSTKQRQRTETNKPIKRTVALSAEQLDLKVSQGAESLLREGNVAQAQQTLSDFLQRQPLAKRSGEMLVSLLIAQNKQNQAQSLLTPLREAAPRDIGLLAVQARLYLLAGNTQRSVDLLMSEKPSIQGNLDYYELLALAARQNKQYLLSEQAYRGLVDFDARRGDWWVGLAIAMDAQGKIAQARSAYKRALKTNRVSKPLGDYARQRLAVAG